MMQCAVNGCPYEVAMKEDAGGWKWHHVGTHGVVTGHAAVPKKQDDPEYNYSKVKYTRPLAQRLEEYRDAMIETREGLLAAAELVEKTGRPATPIRDGANFYQFVIGDLTNIIEGKELKRFEVQGILTDD